MSELTLQDYFLVNKVFSVVNAVAGIAAAFGNFVLAFSIIRSTQLRSKCSALIAIQAISEIVYPMSFVSLVYFSFAEVRIPRSSCLWWEALPLVAANVSVMMMSLVALDRFLSFKAPVWYKTVDKRRYLLSLLCLPGLHNVLIFSLGYFYLDDEDVFCRIPDGLSDIPLLVWVIGQVVIAAVVLFLYLLMRWQLKNTPPQRKDLCASINKSLRVIFVLYLCGYTLFAVVNLGAAFLENNNLDHIIGTVTSTNTFVNTIAPVFVFYHNSSLYRREIRKTLTLLLRRPTMCQNTVVHVTSMTLQ